MPLRIYNTLSKDNEVFEPITPHKVNMYVCGITPYDEPHLGHARAYITFDVIRRYLEHLGYKVNYVQNITDIDDKIIKRAAEEGKTTTEIVAKYSSDYFSMMDALMVLPASMYPRATEHIRDMIETIKTLIAKGFAYVLEGDVYFEVAKFKGYGKLSGRDEKAMMAGARVAVDERKKSPLDFALWKAAKPNEPSWESPWGEGRPGWHIECSTMSTKYLGETFDIHGGGLDLVFPHHENEIAQSEAATDKPFAKYWIHNGFVTVNKEKMSKSLKNFFTIKEILSRFKPQVVRLFLLSTHYRSPVNYSDDDLKAVANKLFTIQEGIDYVNAYINASPQAKDLKDHSKDIQAYKGRFSEAMDSDFNTAGAIGVIFEALSFAYDLMKGRADKKYLMSIRVLFNEFFGVLGLDIKETSVPEDISRLLHERDLVKRNKEFKKADEIRDKIQSLGYSLKDTAFGSIVSGGA